VSYFGGGKLKIVTFFLLSLSLSPFLSLSSGLFIDQTEKRIKEKVITRRKLL